MYHVPFSWKLFCLYLLCQFVISWCCFDPLFELSRHPETSWTKSSVFVIHKCCLFVFKRMEVPGLWIPCILFYIAKISRRGVSWVVLSEEVVDLAECLRICLHKEQTGGRWVLISQVTTISVKIHSIINIICWSWVVEVHEGQNTVWLVRKRWPFIFIRSRYWLHKICVLAIVIDNDILLSSFTWTQPPKTN